MRKLIIFLLCLLLVLPIGSVLAQDETPPPPPDIEPPHSTITSPENGQVLTTLPIVVSGTATDNERVLKVELEIRGPGEQSQTILCSSKNSDFTQWEYIWLNPAPGSYTLTSIATDYLMNTEEELETISVEVNPQTAPPADTYPPSLLIFFPPVEEFESQQSRITIEGQTEAGAQVWINSQTVTVDENGYFSSEVTLNPGTNSFLIKAQDQAGNQSQKTLTFYFQTPSSPTPTVTETPSSPTPSQFPDIAGHWAEDLILRLTEAGIITGYPDGTFRPESTITRAEFSAILCRALNLSPQGSSSFSDTQGHWAEGYIQALSEKGYINGYPDGSFKPDDQIKRAEIAAIIMRVKLLPPMTGKPSFSDVDSTHWAFSAIEAAYSGKIVSGYPDGIFKPESPSTRAEACAIIARAFSF